jgi:chromosome segregation ATPase
MLLRRPPDSLWALALLIGLCAILLLLAATQKLHGQSESGSGPPSLTQNLSEAEMNLRLLMERLTERQQQVADLQSNLRVADAKLSDLADSLAILQAELEQAQASQKESETALMETSTSLDVLLQRYNELDKAWKNYRTEAVKQITDLEKEYKRARRWAIGFGVSTAVGFLLSLFLALK